MDNKALYNLTYGLFLLSAGEDGRDNACIVNTVIQAANDPVRLSVASIKGNLTHDMIAKTGRFNVSVITEDAPFELFERFGLQSGRNTDKFAGFEETARSENGLIYLTKWANAFMSAKVTESFDLGSHTLYVGELTDAGVLSSGRPCTYAYYHSNIKKNAAPTGKKGWKCSVCGYVYEGDELPADFVCPLCRHTAEHFERIEPQTAKKWVCPVCGYVHTGEQPPEVCPVCRVPGTTFKQQ